MQNRRDRRWGLRECDIMAMMRIPYALVRFAIVGMMLSLTLATMNVLFSM
jgi:hypothetical protein